MTALKARPVKFTAVPSVMQTKGVMLLTEAIGPLQSGQYYRLLILRMQPCEWRLRHKPKMLSEKEMRELAEAARKMEPLEPSRRPPPLFYVYVAIVVILAIYGYMKSGKPTTDAELKKVLRETQQEDARKELERAADAYRRTLSEPSPFR